MGYYKVTNLDEYYEINEKPFISQELYHRNNIYHMPLSQGKNIIIYNEAGLKNAIVGDSVWLREVFLPFEIEPTEFGDGIYFIDSIILGPRKYLFSIETCEFLLSRKATGIDKICEMAMDPCNYCNPYIVLWYLSNLGLSYNEQLSQKIVDWLIKELSFWPTSESFLSIYNNIVENDTENKYKQQLLCSAFSNPKIFKDV